MKIGELLFNELKTFEQSLGMHIVKCQWSNR